LQRVTVLGITLAGYRLANIVIAADNRIAMLQDSVSAP
jgi:hypothetical protein